MAFIADSVKLQLYVKREFITDSVKVHLYVKGELIISVLQKSDSMLTLKALKG